MEKGLISIDRWGNGSQAYFLTHLHGDHTKGLSSKWSKGPLLCSSISAKLLPTKFPGFDTSLIRVLETAVTQLILLRSPSSGSEVRLFVTPVDAHHCPGAVMYLFRGEFGCVLHTGDFRWEIRNERAEKARKTLLDSLEGHKVDVLYLDNTYCHPSFSFPTREVAAQQVLDIINSNPDHEVIIGIDTLGKEDLLLHISRALGIKIWVWPQRLKTMHLLGFNYNFTTNTSLTRVRAVPRYSLTHDTLAGLNTFHPTIGILPSGVPRRAKFSDENHSIHYVQYSEHSCFFEIQEFVKLIHPSKLIGLVSSSTSCINPQFYFNHLYGNDDQLCNISLKEFINEQGKKNENEGGDERLLVSKRVFKWKTKEVFSKVVKSNGQKGKVHIMRRGKFGVKIAEGEESVYL